VYGLKPTSSKSPSTRRLACLPIAQQQLDELTTPYNSRLVIPTHPPRRQTANMSTTRPGAATARYSLVLSLVLLYLPSLMAPALAFNFTTNTTAVSACGDMLVTWEGGSPPYNLTIIVSRARHRSLRIVAPVRRMDGLMRQAEADWPGTFNLSEVFSDVELQLVDGVWYGQWTYTVACEWYGPGVMRVVAWRVDLGGKRDIYDASPCSARPRSSNTTIAESVGQC